MSTKFDILFTFKFVYYFWKKIYIAPLMLALLLATIIIFKTDIRPEAGCHLYIYNTIRNLCSITEGLLCSTALLTTPPSVNTIPSY